MAGATHQIQLRHILVDKKEVAELLLETIRSIKSGTGRVKMLMNLAEKYSACPSREDGGNLGWVEIEWNPGDVRRPRGGFKKLENEELYEFIRSGLEEGRIEARIPFGPVHTKEGYHVGIIANEVQTDRIL